MCSAPIACVAVSASCRSASPAAATTESSLLISASSASPCAVQMVRKVQMVQMVTMCCRNRLLGLGQPVLGCDRIHGARHFWSVSCPSSFQLRERGQQAWGRTREVDGRRPESRSSAAVMSQSTLAGSSSGTSIMSYPANRMALYCAADVTARPLCCFQAGLAPASAPHL